MKWTIILALFCGGCDALSKYWIQGHLPHLSAASSLYPFGGIGVFQDFLGIDFSLVHATNRGAAWGIFAAFPSFLLAFRITLVSLLIGYLSISKSPLSLKKPLIFIVAGALCNILDKFIYGHVVDLFRFQFGSYVYPVFNIADAMICVGVGLILIRGIKEKRVVYGS